jgi:iron-sulfur cluster assembly accessory protein
MGTKMITLTEAAVKKVSSILVQEGPDAKLRMYVSGKGCAGLTYGFGITTETEEDDVTINEGEVTVVIDADSLPYLRGSVVDFIDGLTGSKFDIKNPNAKSACGCGDSFNPY